MPSRSTTAGILFSYSRADGSVLRYDIRASAVRGRDPLDVGARLTSPAITAAGDAWAVVDTEDGDVWLRGADAATSAPTTGSVVVGEPDAGGSAVYLADETALVRVRRGRLGRRDRRRHRHDGARQPGAAHRA